MMDLVTSIDALAGVAALALSVRILRMLGGLASHLGVKVAPDGKVTLVVATEPS